MIRLLALVLGTLAFASLLSAAPPTPAESPFGINGCSWSHLGANTDSFQRDFGLKRLAALRRAGAKWDRCDFWWARIEPEQGKFLWRDYDWIVQQYVRSGIQVMPILCYQSAWGKAAPADDAERQNYGKYVFETVSHFKKDVHVWEIWNEPNIAQFWAPAPDAKAYAALLKVAYASAKKADPNCTVVGGVTAGVDFGFIEELLQQGAGEAMDAISVHPYQGNLGSVSPDQGGLAASLRGVQGLLAEYGLKKAVYATEIGYRTTGGKGDTSVTEEQQAAYLVRSYVLALSAGTHRVFWFNLQDFEEFWGIMTERAQEKPSFKAYQTMVRNLEGKRPAGTVAVADGVVGHAFTTGATAIPNNTTLVVWSTDDAAHPAPLRGRRMERADGANVTATANQPVNVGAMPIFITTPNAQMLAQLKPLPAAPEPAKSAPVAPKAPPLPPANTPWHITAARNRVALAIAMAAPLKTPTPLVIPTAQLPTTFRAARALAGVDAVSPTAIIPFQRDVEGNLIGLLPPGDATRTYYLYATPLPNAPGLIATDSSLSNGQLTLTFANRAIAKSAETKSGFATKPDDEVAGLFVPAYVDVDGAWQRADENAKVLTHSQTLGPLFAQYRSKISFGSSNAQYEFTYTLMATSPRVLYTGKWLSPGAGATKPTVLVASFPTGSVVTGLYADATLPSPGPLFPHLAVVRPAGVQNGAVTLMSNGTLTIPSSAPRSLAGTEGTFPSSVMFDLGFTETTATTDAHQLAHEQRAPFAFPPAIVIGAVENQPPKAPPRR